MLRLGYPFCVATIPPCIALANAFGVCTCHRIMHLKTEDSWHISVCIRCCFQFRPPQKNEVCQGCSPKSSITRSYVSRREVQVTATRAENLIPEKETTTISGRAKNTRACTVVGKCARQKESTHGNSTRARNVPYLGNKLSKPKRTMICGRQRLHTLIFLGPQVVNIHYNQAPDNAL